MDRSNLYNLIRQRKVLICVMVGILFLLLCLAITYNYFGIRDFDKSKLVHFAENLANGLEDDKSLDQWLFATQDSLELWITNEFEEKKAGVIEKIVKYLETHVPWWRIWLSIIAFIATCLFIFEFFRRRIAQIVGEDRAPFSWKLDTGIISKFRNLETWKPIVVYLSDGLTDWAKEKVTLAKAEINKITDEQINKVFARLKDFDIEKTFSESINFELSKGSLLFLIDKVSSTDHFAQFWALAVQEFETKGIPTNYYFFNGDPRLCFGEAQEKGVSLSDLAERHPDSILVVIGHGNMMIQSSKCELRTWTPAFRKWDSRFLLSPRNFFSWGRRESSLKELFHLLPAKFSSLNYVGNTPNKEGLIDYQIETHALEHVIDYEEDIFNENTIQKYFANYYDNIGTAVKEKKVTSQPLLDWIRSCAIHKTLDFQLSLELGKANFDRFEDSEFTPEVILSVFQLPWFRTGKIDDATRAVIAKKFDEESVDVAGDIRKFLKMKLPKWRPPENSHAGDILSETEQINEWKIQDPEPDRLIKKKVKNELNKIYDRGIEPDRILTITDGIHNRYSNYFHPRLRPLIFNHGYSGLGLTRRFKNFLYSLLAGLILLLTYCIIIWLSRPLSEATPCPDYACAPITQVIGASQGRSKKITLTGNANNPLLAHVSGFNKDCCIPLEILGSGVDLRIGKHTIGWSSGDTIHEYRQLGQGETLRIEIRGEVDIIVTDSISLTTFVSLFDSVKVQVINLRSGSSNQYGFQGYDVRFSEVQKSCSFISSGLTELDTIRRDTGHIGILGDTLVGVFFVNCIKPDTLITRIKENEIRFIYQCGHIIYRDTLFVERIKVVREVIPCDSIHTHTNGDSIPCPPLIKPCPYEVNISCLGDDLKKVMNPLPTIFLNGRSFIDAGNFKNPKTLPSYLDKDSILNFTISPPYTFMSGTSELTFGFDEKQRQIGLNIYDPTNRDTIVQLNGEIKIRDSSTNYQTTVEYPDKDVKLILYEDGIYRDTIPLKKGTFCKDINNLQFCDSFIQIEYKGRIYGSKLIRDYKTIKSCRVGVCVYYGTVAISPGN